MLDRNHDWDILTRNAAILAEDRRERVAAAHLEIRMIESSATFLTGEQRDRIAALWRIVRGDE